MEKKLRGKNTRGHDLKESSSRVLSSSTSAATRTAGVITLLTDFGTADYFVGSLKGAILAVNPQARVVDITHDIPPQDIEAGAFTLLASYSTFPEGTIHIAVVDPGVGSTRRAILIKAGEQFFVGPDNGIFSYVCDQLTDFKVFHLTNTEYFRHPVSATFNGRDVFVPVAAALSNGVAPDVLGTPVTDFVKLKPLTPGTSSDGKIKGRIIHIDRFGNCVTNISEKELTPKMIAAEAKLKVKGQVVKSFRNYFTERTGSREKIFGIWGSAGFLEVAATNDSAAKLLNARRGDPVIVFTR